MNFVEQWENIKKSKNILKYVAIALFSLNIIQVIIIGYISVHRQVMIQLPPTRIVESINFASNEANPAFFKMWARYVVSTLTNYTQNTIDDNIYIISQYLHPKVYNKLVADLNNLRQTVKENRISQSFLPNWEKAEYDYRGNYALVKVKGKGLQYIGFKQAQIEEEYQLKLLIEDGHLYIIDVVKKIEKEPKYKEAE